MFQGLPSRLLLPYLIVMEIIVILFCLGLYSFSWYYFQGSRTKTQKEQLEQNLRILAKVVSEDFRDVQNYGNQYFQKAEPVPWRDLFNPEQQSIEWFDAQGRRFMSQGNLQLDFRPQLGFSSCKREETAKTDKIRRFIVCIYKTSPITKTSSLEGYILVSQATESLDIIPNELLWGLGIALLMSLGIVGLGGFWLVKKAVVPEEQIYKKLQQFTADASHEFRGPLTAIKTSVDVILNHPERIHPKDAKKLAAIASATTQMIELTEDLLFLARTDNATLPSESQWKPIFLNEVLQSLVELLEPMAQSKDISLHYHQLATVFLLGNETQLTNLFSNLIRNAIIYTPGGGKVILSITRNNRFALINIADTGIGIAQEELPFIFDRFWRSDKARSRQEGGTGLGLSIAQTIAQLHGGKITVSSQLGIGSCFTVYLIVKVIF